MKKKRIIILSIIVIAILIIYFAGRAIYDKMTLRYISSFHDNQDSIVKIDISLGNGYHGVITDKEMIEDIIKSFDEIQVRKSKQQTNISGWLFHIRCYNENDQEIFILNNSHPWFIKGNLSEGFYKIMMWDEFKQIYEEKIYPYANKSSEEL